MSTLDDQLALNRLMARYVDAANRRDGDAWAGTWDDNACWALPGIEVVGRDNIVALWRQVLAGFEFAILMPGSGHYEIDGDNATGHWYLQEFTRDHQGEALAALSRYTDRCARIGGDWRFVRREYHFLYRGPADLSGDFSPLPPAG